MFMIVEAPGATRVVLRELHEKRAKGVNNQFVPWDHRPVFVTFAGRSCSR